MYVRNIARGFHRSNIPALLFKLDIAKAFDTVHWDYLLDLMRRQGFPQKWCDWLSSIWASSSSRVIVNGVPGPPIQHGRGLRQGDPLSPMLFAIAIDPLVNVLRKATENGRLSKLRGRHARLQISLYADDAAVFVAPIETDVRTLKDILYRFGLATRMVTNVEKCTVTTIRCAGVDLDRELAPFPAKRVAFPFKYLGLPLTIHRLRRVDFQPLIDKVAGRLSSWQGRLLSIAGCNTLVKAVLSSQPIYFLTALRASDEVFEEIDSRRKRFLYAGLERILGGKCKVNWRRCNRPTKLGGFGILDLRKFARALRIRWLWHYWKSDNKPWVGTEIPCDEIDRQLFNASTTITIGDRSKVHFWQSAWLEGQAPKDLAPNLFASSKKKCLSIRAVIQDNSWVRHIRIPLLTSQQHFVEFVNLWTRLQSFELRLRADQIESELGANEEYSTKSAYMAQFLGAMDMDLDQLIWKA